MSHLEEDEYDSCHTNDNLTDSSQSSLQTILVTFRIEKPSDIKHIKRVRFNSLVEVKLIPRRKKEKKRKNKLETEDENVEDATEKTNDEIEADNCGKELEIKGDASICEQWVATATRNVSEIRIVDSCSVKTPQKSDAKVEKASNKPPWNSVMNLKTETSVMTKSLINNPANENGDSARVYAGVVRSRTTFRESYTTNKITLGGDYIGNAIRLSPTTFPISPPIQFSEFPARNAKRHNLQELGSKAVWQLEKQAVKFCQEAEALITQVTEKNVHIQSKLKEQSDALLLVGSHRHTFPNEYTSFRKPSSMPDLTTPPKPVSQDAFGAKPVTRFPYIKHKKRQSIMGLSTRSSSELCLPQLLLFDGNGARSPLAKADGKGENADSKESKFEQVKPEQGVNGKLFIQYSYGAVKRLGLK